MTSIPSLSSAGAAATSLVKSVSALDTNGDGTVSAAELAAAQSSGDEDATESSTEASATAKLTSLLTNLSLDGSDAGTGAGQAAGPNGPPPAGGPPPGGPPPAGGPPPGVEPPAGYRASHGGETQPAPSGASSSDTANTLLASIVERYQAN